MRASSIVILLLSASAWAAVINVPCCAIDPIKTLLSWNTTAQNNDIIQLAPGTYTGDDASTCYFSMGSPWRNLTLQGAGAGVTQINCGVHGWCLRDGNAEGQGDRVRNLTMHTNKDESYFSGGALGMLMTGTNTTGMVIENAIFHYWGSAFVIKSPGDWTFNNVSFVDNRGTHDGSLHQGQAISTQDQRTTIRIINCYFSSNSVPNGGASTVGINYAQSRITILGSTFYSNRLIGSFNNNYNSDPGAGAVGIYNAQDAQIINNTFIANSASQVAGAIYISGNSPVNVVGNNFTGNLGGGDRGGAIATFGTGLVTIDQCRFVANDGSASSKANGALNVAGTGIVRVTNCVFVGNGLSGVIGGISLQGTYLSVANSTFAEFYGVNGAAISANGGTTLVVDTVTVDNSLSTSYALPCISLTSTNSVNLTRVTCRNAGGMYLYNMPNNAVQTVAVTITGTFIGPKYYISNSRFSLQDAVFVNGRSIDANGGGCLVAVSAASVSCLNCSFTNCQAVNGGGAIYVASGSYMNVSNSRFVNSAASIGGAIYSTASYLTVTGSTFTNSSATTTGAVASVNGATTLLAGCSISGGSAVIMGGAAAVTGGASMTVSGCSFIRNSCPIGGAVYADSTASIDTSTFANNTAGASGSGGDLYVDTNGVFGVNTTTFTSANAQYGGSVYVTGIAYLSTSKFKSSTSSQGGAIDVATFGTVIGRGLTLSGHSADLGGAVFIGPVGSLVLEDSSFTACSSSTYGGAISTSSITQLLSISNTTFQNNVAILGGGAVAVRTGIKSCSISLSTFDLNSASQYYGGALFAIGSCNISGSLMTRNNAAAAGGAIYATTGYISLVSSTILHNSAVAAGGVYVYINQGMVVSQTTISQNTGSSKGSGGVQCAGCHMTVTNSTLTGNSGRGAACLCTGAGSLDVDILTAVSGNTDSSGSNLLQSDTSACGSCPDPADPVSLSAECFNFPGRQCSYSCAAGYSSASSNFHCNTGASVTPSQLCIPISCAQLPSIPNGIITQPNPAATPDVASVTCSNGYEIYGGTPSLNCVGPNWIGTLPQCVVSQCQNISAPLNGFSNGTSGVTGDILSFWCRAGFSLIGNTTSVCRGSGYGWVPAIPSCYRSPCATIGSSPYRTHIINSGANVMYDGDTVTFACDPGYAMNGTALVTCRAVVGGNAYDPGLPTCNPIACPPLNVSDGEIVGPAVPVTGDVVTFSCNERYVLVGASSSLCLGYNWTVNAPECILGSCESTDQYNSTCSGNPLSGDSCDLRCQPGHSDVPMTVTCHQVVPNANSTYNVTLPACNPCPPGSFNADGGPTCTLCPANGHTYTTGCTSQDDCQCQQGMYEANEGRGDCIACIDGAYCAGDKARPVSSPGFYPSTDAAGKQVYLPCHPTAACAGNDHCAPGYTEYLCAKCETGYYQLNSECHACPNDGPWRIVLGIIGGLVGCVFLMFVTNPSQRSERTYGFGSITVGLTFVQITATFIDLRVNWGSNSRSFFDGFSSLNLNIEITNPDCVIKLNFYDKFQAQMLMPFIVSGFIFVTFLILSTVKWIRQGRPSWTIIRPHIRAIAESAVSGSLFFYTLAYLFLARSALSILSCKQQLDGAHVLVASPVDKCFTPQWYRNLAFGIFGIVFYIGGIPFSMLALYLYLRRKHGALVAAESVFCNFYVAKYGSKAWYWETLVTVRKLLIVIVAQVLTFAPSIQVVLCCVVFFFSCVITLWFRPYRWGAHNTVDCLTLIGSIVVLFCGQLSANDSASPAQQSAVDIIVVVTIVIVLVGVAACFVLEAKVTYDVSALWKRVGELETAFIPHGTDNSVGLAGVGRHVVVATDTGVVRMWNKDTLEARPVLRTSTPISVVGAMDPLTIVGGDRGVAVWNAFAGVRLWEYRDLPAEISCVSGCETVLAVGCRNGEVMVFTRTGPLPRQSSGNNNKMERSNSDERLSQSRELLRGSGGSTTGAQPAGTQASSLEHTFDPHVPEPASGLQKALGAAESQVNEIALGGLKYSKPLVFDTQSDVVLAVHAEPNYVYVADSENRVTKWQIKRGTVFRRWMVEGEKRKHTISAMLVTGDSLIVAIGHRVHIIDLENDYGHIVPAHRGRVTSLTMCGDRFVTGSTDGSIKCWTLDGEYLQALPTNHVPVRSLASWHDSWHLHAALADGTLHKFYIAEDWDVGRNEAKSLEFLSHYKVGRCCLGEDARAHHDATEALDTDLGVGLGTPQSGSPGSRRPPRSNVLYELQELLESQPEKWWRDISPEDATRLTATVSASRVKKENAHVKSVL